MVLWKGKGAAAISYKLMIKKVQNSSKIPLLDDINNTIYTTLAQHTNIHSTFYLIIIVKCDAKEGGRTMTMNFPKFYQT
jgi:hypothetical protein